MSDPNFRRKQYSTKLPFVYQPSLTGVTLTSSYFDGSTLQMRMRRPTESEYKINAEGAFDGTDFTYEPVDADVDESGWFLIEFIVTDADDKVERWPTHGYLTCLIEPAL